MTYPDHVDRSTIPVACSLSTNDAARQVLEWAELRSRARSTEPLDDGASMTFPDEFADAVDDLARREAACCAFLTINTTQRDGVVVVEITTANPDGVGVIDMIAGITRP